MCGIIGINRKDEKEIRDALSLFKYRGPDSSNIYNNGKIIFGHNRLKIIDLDPRSDQPMKDADDILSIVFNGEIYNFEDIKKELSSKYSFRTTSDTEVLLYAYREFGKGMVQHIQGMYAFAIYDKNINKILLFRDHAGIKPLYYYFKDDLFIFSSEIKGIISILKKEKIELKIDKKSLDLFSVLGYIPSPHTLFENIFKVEKSSIVEFDINKNEINKEYYLQKVDIVNTEDGFTQIFEEKVLGHLVSDVPVGLFFSGGTDSSLIASILHKNKINLETFSIKMERKNCDEKHFLAISNFLDLKSHVSNFSVREFDDIYREVMDKIDEPLYDNSIFPTYFVSKKASEMVSVVLSGEGGDEFFSGYPRNKILSKLNSYQDYNITLLDKLYFWLPVFRGKNYFFEKIFKIFKKPLSYYLITMSPARDLVGIRRWVVAKEEFKNKKSKPIYFDRDFYLENDLLKKTDMATSYNSIEGRVPLLDVKIISNAKFFEKEHLKGGILKAFLKKILLNYLPSELVYREKSGFGLGLKDIFSDSRYLKRDFELARKYLKEKGIELIDVHLNENLQNDEIIKRYPNYCFSLISLFYVLKNIDSY